MSLKRTEWTTTTSAFEFLGGSHCPSSTGRHVGHGIALLWATFVSCVMEVELILVGHVKRGSRWEPYLVINTRLVPAATCEDS